MSTDNWNWISLDRTVSGERLTPTLNERMSRLSGTVNQKQRKLVVDVRDFGAQGNGKTDDLPAFQKAHDSLSTGGTIVAPYTSKGYFMDGDWNLTHTIWFTGSGSKIPNSQPSFGATKLIFAADANGIIINQSNTFGATKVAANTYPGATNSVIENVSLESLGGTVGHGIWCRARATIRDVNIKAFAGNGLNLVADAGSGSIGANLTEGNDNGMFLLNVVSQDTGGHGFYVDGADANAGTFVNCSAQRSGGNGFYDSSFLGNTYVGCQSASSVLCGYRTDGTGAHNVFFGCYLESGGPTCDMVSPTMVIGGILAAASNHSSTSTALIMSGAGQLHRAALQHRNTKGTTEIRSNLGFNDSTMSARSWGSTDAGSTADDNKELYDPTLGLWAIQNAGSAARQWIKYPGLLAASLAGLRAVVPIFRNGVILGDVTASLLGSLHTVGTALPTTGTFEQSDFRWLSTTNRGSKPGWMCYQAGTMGTLNGGATTGGITSGTPDLVVSSASGLLKGQYITIAGVTGIKKIAAIVGTAVTLNSNADATVVGAAVAFSAALWQQMASLPSVSADKGNAAATLSPLTSERTSVWNTPLTANRAVTLSTSGVENGAFLRVVRTAAATGAFTLNVGTGPLKALGIGQSCDVEYDGTNWVLTAVSTL